MRIYPILLALLFVGCGSSDATEPLQVTITGGGGVSHSPAEPTEPAEDVEPAILMMAEPVRATADLVIETPRCLRDAPTCYPILLAHGFMANPEFLEFFGVADHLRALGFVVVEGAVEPFDAVEVRGTQLAAQIEGAVHALGVDKVHVIAQSMGGLDARYAISSKGVGRYVATLTTISTPHRGSAAADMFLDEEFVNDDSPIVRGVLLALGTQYSDGLAEDPKLRAGLASLAERNAPAFNANNADDSGVVYESWAGVSSMFGIGRSADDDACEGRFWQDNGETDELDPVFYATAPLVAEGAARLPNDGMVTVESAKWGTFRGCIRADHADEVGQMQDAGPDPRTGFDHLEFYEFLAHDLAAREP